MDAQERAARIKLMAFDIDGVMTDGSLHYTDDGRELKTFNVLDGFGIKMAQRAGMKLAIVTGRTSGAVAARAAELGIEHLFQGIGDKRSVMGGLIRELGLYWPDVAFMGDDLIDLPAMQACGLALAPANALAVVKQRAHLVTHAGGGHGAVREGLEFVLAAQGKLDALYAPYLDPQ